MEDTILYGMNKIQPVVGNASCVTVLKWKREYEDFPIRKLGGQWVSDRRLLAEWWRNFVLSETGERKRRR